jgi:hypothetical protein
MNSTSATLCSKGGRSSGCAHREYQKGTPGAGVRKSQTASRLNIGRTLVRRVSYASRKSRPGAVLDHLRSAPAAFKQPGK